MPGRSGQLHPDRLLRVPGGLSIGHWNYLLIASLIGWLYPRVWLKDSLKKRQKLIVKALPIYLDFLTMGVEAGLNMARLPFRRRWPRDRTVRSRMNSRS
ncbi:hypothetical protein LP419_11195 [Massilia sp. H-1]|nr:hypothetical protein LP419_11195 [Massilia sp. H-1]